MQNQTLYKALVSFPLAKTGGRYTFLDRLRRENNWSEAEALQAIGEYKRFVYLARVSPVPVTPPPAVDQVWHLHLLYTRSYWEDLCQGVLERPLHHGPTAGGREEDEKFEDWYGRTRTLYQEEFGVAPPADLWPARFTPEKRYQWTDLARNWIIRKPSFGARMPGVFPLLLLSAPSGALAVLLLIFAVLAVVAKLALVDDDKEKRRNDRGGCSGSGCGGFTSIFGSGSDCGDSSGGGDCGGGDGGGCCGGGGCGGGCGGGD